MPTFVHYVPIATTIVAAFFATIVLRRYAAKGGTHLLWWGIKNLYAAAFLIGGAIVSAMRFRTVPEMRGKYIGNIFIAVGALLPGICGTFTRFGHVEVLYVTEFVGLMLIYVGYLLNVQPAPAALPAARALGLGGAR